MGKIFDLITQFRNLTDHRIVFRVDDGNCSLPELLPRKTRMVKQSRILRHFRRRGSNWKIQVFAGDEFTGIELDPRVVLHYVRVLFRTERNGSGLDVVCVDGVRENHSSDYLLRHRYFGCMRNICWDGRPIETIARSDSRLATKLRNLEGHCQHLAPFVDTTSVKRQCASPLRKGDRHEEKPREEKRKRDFPISPAVDNNDEIKSQPNVTAAVRPEKPMIIPEPPPPPLPPPPHVMRSTVQTTVNTEDSSGNQSSTSTIAMDSFVHAILFLFALSLVRFLPMLFR